MSSDITNPFLDDENEDTLVVESHDSTAVDSSVSSERKPWERDYTDEQRAEMKARKAAGELLPGHKKHKGSYHRRDVTDKDLDLLAFIARFKYSTERQMTLIAGVQARTVYKRMMGLRELKLAQRVDVPGANRLWLTTQRAHTLLEQSGRIQHNEVRLMREKDIALDQLAHTLAVNQTAAWLMRGMPVGDHVPDWVRVPYAMDALISEYQVRKGWEQFLNTQNTEIMDRGHAGARKRAEVASRVKAGKLAVDEMHDDEPSLWTLSNSNAKSNKTKQFHYPDLVINRESMRDGSKPQSIAFEIELTAKNRGETARILRMFKDDRMTYKHVVWVVQSQAMQRHLIREDREVGLVEDGRMTIIGLRGSDGSLFTDRPWTL